MRTAPLNWVGGEHVFDLRIGELRRLQEVCEAGPEEVLNRLRSGTWRVDDLIEPIRLGLIGSGAMDGPAASAFVTGLFDRHPKAAFKLVALEIMARALLGYAEDPVGEPAGETPPPENGVSASSTATGS